jgi:glycosyltransferase involved in cell wall biosynthesis
MSKLPLSLVIITLNEEKNIERCIKSAAFASEVVVLDSGSQDRTLEIAKSLGAQVYNETWRGFGAQKARASELAKFDWILNLDADEQLTPELCLEIEHKFQQLQPEVGYQFPRRSYYLNRWIDHGGWYPDRQLRLYNRKYSNWDLRPIHEKVQAKETECFEHNLNHYVFKNIAAQIAANNRYSSLQAEELFRRGLKFSFFKLLVKPHVKFLETYFFKLGFLDGLPGFIISVSAGYSVFLRWAKIWELERQKRE